MAAPTDAELLPRLLAGEQRAFRELVGAYQGAMRAVAWAIIGRSHTEEVVQDAWLAAVRGLDGFQGRSSLKTWLLTITAIRDLLDITLSNVRVLLHRARLKVFATLEHFEETGQC